MNLNAMRAADQLQTLCDGLSPEETIEICDAAIDEAERIKEICEKEIEEQEQEDDPY